MRLAMKKIITILILMVNLSMLAQESLIGSIFQDVKLATIGDNRGNNAYTMNLLFELNLELRQNSNGFGTVGFTYEKANLVGEDYIRWAVQFGYVFNSLFLEDLEIAVKLNWGGIKRFEVTKPSLGGSVDVLYNLTNWLAFSTMFQLVQRSDKTFQYGKYANYTINFMNTDFSFLIGFVFKISKLNFSGTYADY